MNFHSWLFLGSHEGQGSQRLKPGKKGRKVAAADPIHSSPSPSTATTSAFSSSSPPQRHHETRRLYKLTLRCGSWLLMKGHCHPGSKAPVLLPFMLKISRVFTDIRPKRQAMACKHTPSSMRTYIYAYADTYTHI